MYRGVGCKQISAAQYSLLIHRHACRPQWMLNNTTAWWDWRDGERQSRGG